MPTKKKSKADAAASEAPADPREALEPTPANLTAALKELKAVLADIPIPDPIIEEPEPEPEPAPVPVAKKPDDDDDEGEDDEGEVCRMCGGSGALSCAHCRGEGGVGCPRCDRRGVVDA